jgi:hypothetical protein
MNTRTNISSIVYNEINKQEAYLDDLVKNIIPISLNIYDYSSDDYKKYKTLQKYHGKHFENVITNNKTNNKTIHKPTIEILDQQKRIHNYPDTMIKKRYDSYQEVRNLVNKIIDDNDEYSKKHTIINDIEDETYYNIPDPQLAMTYYSTKHLI